MEHNNKKWVCLLASTMLATSLLAGCGAQNTPTRPQTGTYSAPVTPGQMNANTPQTQNRAPVDNTSRTPATGTNTHDLRSAQKIADALRTMPGIGGATVLTGYGIAYVAVDVKGQPSTTLTTDVKSKITAKVKQLDPGIKTVLITGDPDVYKHFQNYGRDIAAGRPISGFWNQFQDIVHRVWPTQR